MLESSPISYGTLRLLSEYRPASRRVQRFLSYKPCSYPFCGRYEFHCYRTSTQKRLTHSEISRTRRKWIYDPCTQQVLVKRWGLYWAPWLDYVSTFSGNKSPSLSRFFQSLIFPEINISIQGRIHDTIIALDKSDCCLRSIYGKERETRRRHGSS